METAQFDKTLHSIAIIKKKDLMGLMGDGNPFCE